MRDNEPENDISRVLIVDDHTLVRESIVQWLAEFADFMVVGSTSNLEDTNSFLENEYVDIILLDLGLRDEDALDEIVRWKNDFPEIEILVLSASQNFLIARRCLDSGAAGFVSKSDSADELLEGLRAARKGKTFLSKSIQPFEGREKSNSLPKLTCREEEILREIASGQPNRRIATRLGISTKTVERHRENLKKKLCLSSSSELIREAVRLFPSEIH